MSAPLTVGDRVRCCNRQVTRFGQTGSVAEAPENAPAQPTGLFWNWVEWDWGGAGWYRDVELERISGGEVDGDVAGATEGPGTDAQAPTSPAATAGEAMDAKGADSPLTEPAFAVGDRVRLRDKPDWEGFVEAITDRGYAVAWDFWGTQPGSFCSGRELEPIQDTPLNFRPAFDMVRTTRRRLRVNITKNTKGYSFDHTYEVETDDPALDLAAAMREGLREGDRAAREAIAEAEYTDANGLPGSEDSEPF